MADQTVTVGVRLTEDGGLEFFGTDEVNARLAAGARVVSVTPGQIYLEDLSAGAEDEGAGGDEEGSGDYALAGCEIVVPLRSGSAAHGRGR
jgi:hypothetical protein